MVTRRALHIASLAVATLTLVGTAQAQDAKPNDLSM